MAFRITSAESVPDVKLVVPRRHGDERGYLAEVYRRGELADAGLALDFVQENESFSEAPGTVRGMHFQREPRAQAKLVRVVRGRILDVAVDLRRGSATFGRHAAAELSAADGVQMLVPTGFAHGFCTLEQDTLVLYKLSDYYARELEGGVRWDDPALGIDWPVAHADAVVSEKDRRLPRLAELEEVFA